MLSQSGRQHVVEPEPEDVAGIVAALDRDEPLVVSALDLMHLPPVLGHQVVDVATVGHARVERLECLVLRRCSVTGGPNCRSGFRSASAPAASPQWQATMATMVSPGAPGLANRLMYTVSSSGPAG